MTQVTFRYPNNQDRTAANVHLAWNAKNTTKIITAVEQLNDLMTKKTYLYKKLGFSSCDLNFSYQNLSFFSKSLKLNLLLNSKHN